VSPVPFRSHDDADFILAMLRAGDRPNPDEADELTYAPLMGHLRAMIAEEDFVWLFPLIRTSMDERAGFYISLLHAHAKRLEVQSLLREVWHDAGPLVRSHLLWRLTDDPDLPLEWKERLFEFVLAQWRVFQSAALRFYGGRQDSALAMALERYCGSDFPRSKGWAYLCTIADATKFPNAARTIIEHGRRSDDQFTSEVARRLLGRLTF
jgi:hypothetical protein